MLRYAFLSALLTIPLGLAGQQPVTFPQTSTTPTTATTQENPDATRVDMGTPAAPLLVTPTATFAAPVPTAGISDAGRAGISNNVPINTGITTTLPSTTLVYTTGSPVNAVETNPPAINAAGANPANTEVGTSMNELAPSSFENAPAGSNNVSLGEIARQLRPARRAVNPRTLTNDDLPRLLGKKAENTVTRKKPH